MNALWSAQIFDAGKIICSRSTEWELCAMFGQSVLSAAIQSKNPVLRGDAFDVKKLANRLTLFETFVTESKRSGYFRYNNSSNRHEKLVERLYAFSFSCDYSTRTWAMKTTTPKIIHTSLLEPFHQSSRAHAAENDWQRILYIDQVVPYGEHNTWNLYPCKILFRMKE